MKTWLDTPVTRAEAIGYALAIPGLYVILRGALIVPALLDVMRIVSSRHAELASPTLKLYFKAGPVGLSVVFGLLALLMLLALTTRQRPWVRIAAPLICAALAVSVQAQFATELGNYDNAVTMLYPSEEGTRIVSTPEAVLESEPEWDKGAESGAAHDATPEAPR